jgi:hypothetical protein
MKKYLLFIICISLIGCTSYKPPQIYNIEKTKIVEKSYDVVWSKIIMWFGEHNTPIKNIEKASGFISTEYNLSAKNSIGICDCGEPASLTYFGDTSGNFNIVVERISDNSTKVTISAFFTGILYSPNFANQYAPPIQTKMDCNTTGQVEKEIFDFINK